MSTNIEIPQPRYTLTLKIEEYIFEDINTFYIYRLPFSKSCSFATITMSMPVQFYLTIEDKIENNEFPKAIIDCWTINTLEKSETNIRGYKKEKHIFKKNYIILQSLSKGNYTLKNQDIIVRFFLINPLLHTMSKENSFNKVLRDKKSIEAIEEMESHFKKRYSDSISFKKIGDKYNEYKFEEQLLLSSSNLEMPTRILYNYKPLKSLGYYFFDDFRLIEEENKDICGLLVDISDIKKFQKYDVYEEGREDVQMSSYIFNRKTINDKENFFNKENPTWYVLESSGKWSVEKNDSPIEVKKLSSQSESVNIAEKGERNIGSIISNLSTTNVEPGEMVYIYSCDDTETAKTRFQDTGKFIRENIGGLFSYEFFSIHVDAIQFQRRYNLDPYEENTYNFVPMQIVNKFQKVNLTETFMNHTVTANFLKYIQK